MNKHTKKTPSLPSKADILAFIRERPRQGRHARNRPRLRSEERARAELKRMLRELADEGAIEKRRKKLHHPGALPSTMLADVTGRDADGDLLATPDEWDEEAHGPAPKIRIHTPRKARPGEAAGIGDRVLLRVEETDEEDGIRHRGRVIKIIDHPKHRVLGIFRSTAAWRRHGSSRSTRKCSARSSSFPPGATSEAQDGDLIAVETQPRAALRAAHRSRRRTARLAQERARRQPDRHPRARHPARVSARDAARGRGRQAGDACRSARTGASCRSSPSIRPTPRITTTPCTPSPTPPPTTTAASSSPSPSPTSPIT